MPRHNTELSANEVQHQIQPKMGQSPIKNLTTPTDVPILGVEMPVTGSITQEQLQRDIVRTRKDIERLKKQEAFLLGTLKMYFPEAAKELDASEILTFDLAEDGQTLESHSIVEASEAVFRDLHNTWLTLADLDTELKRRGKVCSKGSIDLMLKAASEKFEFEKRGKRNVYRLREIR